MSNFQLETDRLLLRDIEPDRDASVLFELNNDPEVVRYTGDGPFESEEATRAFFRERIAQYALDGMGRWVVERKADGEVLGWCGLKRHDDGQVDVGYRFFRRYWGHGYATEAARASVEYGFRVLGLPRIIAHVMPENTASRGVMRKLGLRELPGLHDCQREPALLFELLATEWPAAVKAG